jgi:DNA helicase-2/ATP-dependent DNA helicase PcrA
MLEDPGLGPRIASRFEHVLVDEYQDTNRVQRRILLGLRQGDPRVTAVGDDAQAIYGFRGATVENIRAFSADFPGCAVVRLERNYRGSEPLLAVANAVLEQAPGVSEPFRKRL